MGSTFVSSVDSYNTQHNPCTCYRSVLVSKKPVSFLVLSAAFSVENYDFTVSTQIRSLSSAVSGTQGVALWLIVVNTLCCCMLLSLCSPTLQ